MARTIPAITTLIALAIFWLFQRSLFRRATAS